MAILNNKKVVPNVDKEIRDFWKKSRFKKDTTEISKALNISKKMAEFAVLHGYASAENTLKITRFYKEKNQEIERLKNEIK